MYNNNNNNKKKMINVDYQGDDLDLFFLFLFYFIYSDVSCLLIYKLIGIKGSLLVNDLDLCINHKKKF
jgi:hypothetical protein